LEQIINLKLVYNTRFGLTGCSSRGQGPRPESETP